MTVLKKFEPRTDDIKQLEWILDQLTTEQEDIKRRVLVDLKRVRGGDRGKYNASTFIESLFADRKDVIILHDLRLNNGDVESQIDHLVIATDGHVNLFETKNFSNGLKVNTEGQFAYWNRFKRTFYGINSPVENAEKNKHILKVLLEPVFGKVPDFSHYILVDYRAKLVKPEKGFDMIVRSDTIKDLLGTQDSSSKGGIINAVKRLFGLNNSLSTSQLKAKLASLLEQHQALDFNYIEKYGLNLDYNPSSAPQAVELERNYSTEPKLQRLTLAKLAREMAIHPQELQARLVEQGLLEKRGFKTFVSEKGREAGIQFRKGQRGIFFLIPSEMAQNPVLQLPAKTVSETDDQ
ncbi:nuclease-related domain-containing protein [Thiomicrospira sp. R3]|uniref:nuclease-related domain-containing protein n=1 Tax=Thiomicrospira sp. R3 TaxID=3035472 RepID=UPI00259BBA93|nr:nuclease-related domain-containing protein [Thiomicrospira sp. R3]WFE68282.1 nuclease-related domain-containing protein [Thiomicrospira sp. R3]